jgi:hypothetical protein
MPSELHERLSDKAAKWLKRNGFGVVSTNIWTIGSRERVDCIGFRLNCSALIEAKISRADFKADMKKPERLAGGAGTYRFYITPPDLVTSNELPCGWGLLELHRSSVRMIHGPQGNGWPSYENAAGSSWEQFAHARDEYADRALLYSIARRLG